MDTSLQIKLDTIEQLARGSVLGRLLHTPVRYIAAIGFWRLLYPLTRRGKYAMCKTFFGAKMEVVLPSATEIFLFGAKTHDSEIRLARFLMRNLQNGDVFCDVGAHFGYFTLLASQLVGITGRVVAFEASKSTYGILSKNVAGHPNVIIRNRAASDEDKLLVFNEFPPLFSEYNSLFLPTASSSSWLKKNPPQRVEVQGVRLSDVFAKEGLRPSIIKIDVEGAEPQVLRGLEDHLRQNNPTLVMEYLLSDGQNEAHREAFGFLQSAGFQCFVIANDGTLEPCDHVERSMLLAGIESDNVVFKKAG